MDASGKRRSSSRRIIRSPTAPLAPTTATCFTVIFPPGSSYPDNWMAARTHTRFARRLSTRRLETFYTYALTAGKSRRAGSIDQAAAHTQLSAGALRL